MGKEMGNQGKQKDGRKTREIGLLTFQQKDPVMNKSKLEADPDGISEA